MGAMHAYEIEFVFGRPLNASLGYTQAEVNMSRNFMSHWANFARTGYEMTVHRVRPDQTRPGSDLKDFIVVLFCFVFFLPLLDAGTRELTGTAGHCSLLKSRSTTL